MTPGLQPPATAPLQVCAALLAVVGCQAPPDSVISDAASPPPPMEGGSITAPGCDYQVTIGVGASAPSLPGAFVGPDPSPFAIHLGLAGQPSRSMVVTWRTRDEHTDVGEVLVDGRAVPALTWSYRGLANRHHRVHEAHICGLAPDTSYSYRIRSGAATTEPEVFRTAPDPITQPDAAVTVSILGDARTNPSILGELLVATAGRDAPQLIVFTGDGVNNGADQDQWDALFAAAGPLLRRVPTLFAAGNHEAEAVTFFSNWALPGNEKWFSVDYGALHLVILDDGSLLLPDRKGSGKAFLEADLPTVAPGRWVVVAHHQPIFSAAGFTSHGSTEALQESWMPLYDQYQVDLVLNGHDHKYERSYPMRAGSVSDTGTTYVVTGAAGAPLYDAQTEVWTARTAAISHYVVLRGSPDSLELRAHDLGGTLLDELTWTR